MSEAAGELQVRKWGRSGVEQMGDDGGEPGRGRIEEAGTAGQVVAVVSRMYAVPPAAGPALLAGGVALGALGDALLRVGGPPGLNLALWTAAVALVAVVLHRRTALPPDAERAAWLAIGVAFAAGLAWRDAPPLKLLALGCATLTFALAAHRRAGAWVRRAGVARYAGALALGALHAWTAAALAVADAARFGTGAGARREAGWRGAAAVARGLVLATPLLVLFGALLMSADAVFADLVASVLRFDVEWIAGHVLLFSILAWLSTGYLRGFLTGTSLPWPANGADDTDSRGHRAPSALALGITEVATVLAAIDLLFLMFVSVQFRYLFGADTVVQITPDLTYADYARRGFFELVLAVALVVPVLLAADWLLDRRTPRDVLVFRVLAGMQIALVLAIALSALQRLRLYHASYGLTESRFYAMVLLIWIAAMLAWLAATVLRGRRHQFAFGALASGLVALALLFAVNPDAVIARTNVARMASADTRVRFDVAYASSLSADAVPILIDALPALPPDVQCPLARHMLRRWPPEREQPLRAWNWAAARAAQVVRAREAQLRSMVGADQKCAAPQP